MAMRSCAIDQAVSDLLSLLESVSPQFQPNVFPSYLPITSPASLFINQEQQDLFQQWSGEMNIESQELVMKTSIDYENRKIVINNISVRPPSDLLIHSPLHSL
jgi:hypothetical protein